jgi:hypothetical protein
MTMPFPVPFHPLRPSGAARALAVALLASVVLLAGCSKDDKKQATQTAAKVGKEEITSPSDQLLSQEVSALSSARADGVGQSRHPRTPD